MNILITGSSSGIGAGLAEYFAQRGHNICVTYHKSLSKAEKILDKVQNLNPNGKHFLKNLDILNQDSTNDLSDFLTKNLGKIDLLVSNAGIDYDSPLEKSTLEDWQNILHTKTDGAFLTTKTFLPLLKKSDNPNIIYISASVGWKPDWHDPAYSSASAAVTNFGQSMAVALSEYSIRCNVVCPGPIKTDLQYWQDVEKTNKEIWKSISESNPLKRLCTTNDIGNLIEYISVTGKYINGNVLYLDGGAHLK